MVFYLIGLGLDEKAINLESLEICKKAQKIFLENYTINFPYDKKKLEETIGKRILEADRKFVEEEKIIEEAKEKDIVLLVYGSPLIATTHISLIISCKKRKIKYKIIHNASIFDAVSEVGLQIYKFGKTTSLPTWENNYKPTSFINVIKQNQLIAAHTLLLVDIGLNSKQALQQLEKASKNKIKLEKIIICSQLGTKNQKIYYNSIAELKKLNIKAPYSIIIPAKLHFLEEEALEKLTK
ncbi:MAG: diphthine synthase [Candidatus Pacearchaeota archaeon]